MPVRCFGGHGVTALPCTLPAYDFLANALLDGNNEPLPRLDGARAFRAHITFSFDTVSSKSHEPYV